MLFLRKLLFPFAILYAIVTSIRNFLFDIGILKSYSFPIPIIAVGNLSVGGTGKTPQIEYLIRLLSNQYQLATLSRGYKRKSKGFILADERVTAEILGDEPFQFHQKYPSIQVAVDANRKEGIETLLNQDVAPQIILLDDAFQHRKVKAGFYILLTAYHDLYTNDWMLPFGNLRERSVGAQRAHCIIVTKCPPHLTATEKESIRKKISLHANQLLFFSTIVYDHKIHSTKQSISIASIKKTPKLIITGIANPIPFYKHLMEEDDIKLSFPDHHFFTDSDVAMIEQKAKNRIIITTEKDYTRLHSLLLDNELFYLPITTSILNDEVHFNQIILNYVGKNSRNSSIH